MRTVGHTIQLCRQFERGRIKVTLECSCGQVFSTCFCRPGRERDAEAAAHCDGGLEAARHIARMDELVKTVGAKQPCAA